MTQHRVLTILLFVSLSLVFEVAQSQLQPLGGPCMKSAECESGCCDRPTRQGSGQCASDLTFPFGSCFGPNDGDRCHYSDECNSRCCEFINMNSAATCVTNTSEVRCFGLITGDLCATSTECDSGCCKMGAVGPSGISKCAASSAEDRLCDLEPTNGFYISCPCAEGLTCEPFWEDSVSGLCKKPNSQ